MNKEIEKTKNYYDAIASGYENLYHLEQENKIKKVLNFLPKNGKVLDLGAGSGVLNQFLDLNKVDLYSVDISKELLKLNSNKKEKKIIADIHSLPFKKNEFDYIISFSVFQDLYDFKKAINEVKRVLKENGIFILSFIKISKKALDIEEEIKKKFQIENKIEEEKDYIFILKNK